MLTWYVRGDMPLRYSSCRLYVTRTQPCGGFAAKQMHDAHDCLAITASGRLSRLRLRAACALACFHEQCMSVWPACWQAGFLSYPRTETDQFDPGYDLRVKHDSKRWLLRCCASDPPYCCSLHAVGCIMCARMPEPPWTSCTHKICCMVLTSSTNFRSCAAPPSSSKVIVVLPLRHTMQSTRPVYDSRRSTHHTTQYIQG